MLVSIVIPCYNGARYARECIDAAINQTYKDTEIIVVDDGSTDDSWDIIQSYPDIIKIRKSNGGTASALNAAIKRSKGDFIRWCSVDDVLLPDAIENMMKFISVNCFPYDYGRAIFYTNYHVIDENGKHLRDFVEPERPESDLWKFFFGNASTSLIYKKIFDRCGLFDELLAHSEDYEFWLRATQLHGILMYRIPIFTLNYRNHPDMLTNKVGGQLDSFIKEKIRNEQSKLVAR